MRILRTWFASSSPVVKMLMAISVTSILAVGHRLYFAPYLRKQRHLRAEEWANTIIEQEGNMDNSADN